nr:sulfatase-like hydrolase/transferase [Chryseolinea lacunae]
MFSLGVQIGYAQKKPNVLCLVLEDTSPDFIGCYGNLYSRTPTIDSLAQIGTRFTNAFSTGTVCALDSRVHFGLCKRDP